MELMCRQRRKVRADDLPLAAFLTKHQGGSPIHRLHLAVLSHCGESVIRVCHTRTIPDDPTGELT